MTGDEITIDDVFCLYYPRRVTVCYEKAKRQQWGAGHCKDLLCFEISRSIFGLNICYGEFMYKPTNFIPANLEISEWSDMQPYWDKLLAVDPATVQELEDLILHHSEVLSVFYEQYAWAYINMTRHTDHEDKQKRFEHFATVILPEVEKAGNTVQQKITTSPYFKALPPERYAQLQREFMRDVELFRENNVALEAKLSTLATEYSQIISQLTVVLEGHEMTIQQASVFLESPDRAKRKTAWLAIMQKRLGIKTQLDDIMNEMIGLRHKIAQNVSYANYRDFKHDALHRFDYSVQDVLCFHDAIKRCVVPLLNKIENRQRQRLRLNPDDYWPWDVSGKTIDEIPLKPFEQVADLLDKTIRVQKLICGAFADNLEHMRQAGFFDLETRPHKAPGGYNYGLEMTGMPFIFMNAAGMHTDVTTLMHESGHAMHTFCTHNEPLIQYRNCPAEVSEVASMSMELISSHHWHEFYSSQDVLRARIDHLEDIVSTFAWVAVVDSFQHWLYTHPTHTVAQRSAQFSLIAAQYESGLVSWDGYESFKENMWQKQLHIFEVPFYYIEYAIAQLGALQIFANYQKDPQRTIEAYIAGLRLGSSRLLQEVWKTLNIKFDFSEANLKSLMAFVEREWSTLCAEYDVVN